MEGGYSIVASELNRWLDWPDGRVVTRQAVQNWHQRRTVNKNGDLPPSAMRKHPRARRTQPVFTFESGDWVTWSAGGVPGAHRIGWVVPVARAEPRPMVPPGRPPEYVQPGDRITWDAALTGIKLRRYTGVVCWTDDAVYCRSEGHMWRVLWASVIHYYEREA